MRVKGVQLGAGVIALVLLVLVLSPRGMAAVHRPANPAAFIPTDPDFPIWDGQGINACSEINADVAHNSSEDEYLVVFEWDLGGTGDRDIMAVTVSADGQPASSPFSVASGDTDDDSRPAVVYNPDEGEYLVVWERNVGGERGVDIFGKIITHSGGLGTEFVIAAYLDNQYSPDVAYAAGPQRYLVVWQDHSRTLTTRPDIYGRCLEQDGIPVGWPLGIGVAAGGQDNPSLATNILNNDWLVVWIDGRSGGWNTYGQEVNSAGDCSLPAGDFAISDQADWIGAPDVGWAQVEPSVSPFGEFLVVWPHGYEMLMLAQRVDGGDYSLLGDPITVSDCPSWKLNPAVVFTGEDWWVVWQDDRDFVDPGSGYLTYGQRVLPDGTVRSASVNQRVSKDPDWLPPSVWQEDPAMAYNPTTGNVLVAWDDHGHYSEGDAGHWGIWGRIWAPVERVLLPLVLKSWP